MTKKILTVISLVLSLVLIFAFVGCSNASFGPVAGGPSVDAKVQSNGGMVVQKGDYYYFINGVENKTAENDFPNVKKGAIYRMKTDFTEKQPTLIVPKIVTSENKDAGLYIFGDYIYYTSPSTDKDRNGVAKFNNLAFCRTKLDGTKTEVLVTLTSYTVQYAFYQENNKVYLAYCEEGSLVIFDVDAKKAVAKYEDVTDKVIMNESGVYFTQNVYVNKKDEEVAKDTSDVNIKAANYNKIFKIDFKQGKAIEFISGKEEELKYSLAAVKDSVVYAYKNKPVISEQGLYAIASDKTETEMTENKYTEVYPISVTEGVIVKNDAEKIIWIKDCVEVKVIETKGTVVDVIGDEIYYIAYTDSKDSLIKKNYKTEDIETTGDVVCDWDINKTFLKPEIVGDKFFFINREHKEKLENEGTKEEKVVVEKYENYMYVATIDMSDISKATLLGEVIDKDQPGYDMNADKENK